MRKQIATIIRPVVLKINRILQDFDAHTHGMGYVGSTGSCLHQPARRSSRTSSSIPASVSARVRMLSSLLPTLPANAS